MKCIRQWTFTESKKKSKQNMTITGTNYCQLLPKTTQNVTFGELKLSILTARTLVKNTIFINASVTLKESSCSTNNPQPCLDPP